ncbi:MAG: NADH-quinone oxidoreductase subunit N [Pseudomonadota bacterium]|nr:NADH-quinone oxidoreductase subunit N [Pseudomonadota bacterium]
MILLPELFVVLSILVMVLLCGYVDAGRFIWILLSGFLISLLAVVMNGQGIGELWRVDILTQTSQFLILLLSAWICYYGRNSLPKTSSPYVFILVTIATVGALVVVSAQSWVLFYMGLELMALPTYALCVVDKSHPTASEAGLKYFVMGVIASIFILYGISFIYLVSESMGYTSLVTSVIETKWYLSIGAVFLLSGILFKFGVAPFHMWVPDVYESAPVLVVNWIAVVPKVAMMGGLVRILAITELYKVPVVAQIFMVTAIVSIGYGVLMAIQQTNLRRLIGYASIAHMGFVMLPLQTASQSGLTGAYIYLLGYVLITSAAFTVLVSLQKVGVENLTDLKGLAKRQPHEAYTLLLSLAAMAGIPPLVGFIIKVNVLNELITAGYIKSVIWAVSFVAISGYYYMSMVRHMFFMPSTMEDEEGFSQRKTEDYRVSTNYIALLWAVGLIGVGVLPQWFILHLGKVVSLV